LPSSSVSPLLFGDRHLPHVAGTPATEYVSEETNLVALSNLHLALEGMRLRARREQLKRRKDFAALSLEDQQAADETEWASVQEDAPRIMVLGPEGSGKTSICKTLLNWTNRGGRGWSPVLVNLDPSEVSARGVSERRARTMDRVDMRARACLPSGPALATGRALAHAHLAPIADVVPGVLLWLAAPYRSAAVAHVDPPPALMVVRLPFAGPVGSGAALGAARRGHGRQVGGAAQK
jgi:hypothetical protein